MPIFYRYFQNNFNNHFAHQIIYFVCDISFLFFMACVIYRIHSHFQMKLERRNNQYLILISNVELGKCSYLKTAILINQKMIK